MIQLALLVVTVCVGAMVFAPWLPGGRMIALAAASVLIYLVGMVAWWSALYSQGVPLGRLLAQLDMHGPNHRAFTAGFFGPPTVPVAVFPVFQLRRRPRAATRSSLAGHRRDVGE